MFRISTDNSKMTLSTGDFALLTHFFYSCSDFHFLIQLYRAEEKKDIAIPFVHLFTYKNYSNSPWEKMQYPYIHLVK